MKRAIIVLASLLMLIPVCASALGLGPEAAVTAINNLVDASPVEGVTQLCEYDKNSNTVLYGVESDLILEAALAAYNEGEDTPLWSTAKSLATRMYDSARELITLYDSDKTNLKILFVTSMDTNGSVYYSIGDDDASERHVILDVITNDTEITPYEEEEKE